MVIKVGQIFHDRMGTTLHVVHILPDGRVAIKFHDTDAPQSNVTEHFLTVKQLQKHIKGCDLTMDILKTARNLK